MIFESRHSRNSLQFLFAGLLFIAAIVPDSRSATHRSPNSPAPPAQQPLQETTELVKLDAAVTDDRGEFVGGLEQKNFKILDRGHPQPIFFFTPTDAPAQILVVVETSPAVYLIACDLIAAVYALASGLAPDDEVGLVAYDAVPRPILAFTQDKSSLAAALRQIQYTLGFGELNLFDSLSSVLDSLQQISGKKALVLLTTGLDSSPSSHREALLQKLRASDVVIFPVALGAPLRMSAKKTKDNELAASRETPVFAQADQVLRSLADLTGGRAFFPESPADFAPMYREIAATLRHQYVLGIAPAHDGQFHALTVQILDSSGMPYPAAGKNISRKVFVRQGYLAPTF